MSVLILGGFLVLFLYIFIIILHGRTFRSVKEFESTTSENSLEVSILIACRNPSDNLVQLIASIQSQMINQRSYEIIIIDDFSNSPISIESDYVKILHLIDQSPHLNPQTNNKKQAINIGVREAQYDTILCLDADVSLSRNWWETWSSFVVKIQPKFAAGIHRYAPCENSIGKLLRLEQDILSAISIAGLYLKFPSMCNGANMMFSKAAFTELNGYEGLYHAIGGDDLFLYHRMYKQFPHDTYYVKSLENTVFSPPAETIQSMLRQRIRWLSKSSHYENSWVNILAIIIFLANFLCLIFLFSQISFLFFGIKIAIDLWFVSRIYSFFELREFSVSQLLLFGVLYPFYTFFVAMNFLFRR